MVKFIYRTIVPPSMVRKTDEQGRLYIPKELREEYGDEFHVVTHADRIELVPVAEDSMEAVRESAGELHDASVEEVRSDAEAAATDDGDAEP